MSYYVHGYIDLPLGLFTIVVVFLPTINQLSFTWTGSRQLALSWLLEATPREKQQFYSLYDGCNGPEREACGSHGGDGGIFCTVVPRR